MDLVTALDEPPDHPFRTTRIVERTSWSCHHGVARWSAECPDAVDGRWKAPLRAAFERLAGAADAVTSHRLARLPGAPDPLVARDAYVDVVLGLETAPEFAARYLGADATEAATRLLIDLLEAVTERVSIETHRLGAGAANLAGVREGVQKNFDVSGWRQKFARGVKDEEDAFDTTFAALITAAHQEVNGR